jgi:beta-lactamase class A
MKLRFLPLLVVFALPSANAQPTNDSLEARLAPLAKAHKGKVAIAVRHLLTGESYTLNGDLVMPTASLIKFPVMLEVYLQAAEGKIKLSDMVTLHDKDKVRGSGILKYHFSEGATFPLRDAVRLMIAYSDNTATNLVLDKIGIDSTNKRMAAWGCPETRINAKVFLGSKTSVNPERTKKYGLGSTTANDMIRLLEKVYKGEVVDAKVCQEMLEHMKNSQFKDTFQKFLKGTVVAHKTGSVSDAKTDAGILYLKSGPVAVCVLTANNADKRWEPDNAGNVLCARVAQEVSRYFAAKAPAEKEKR